MAFQIDLHGLNHKQALSKTENYLLLNSVYKLIDVELVTGKSPELQEKIIEKILVPYKFDYYIPPHNPGIMYISDKDII